MTAGPEALPAAARPSAPLPVPVPPTPPKPSTPSSTAVSASVAASVAVAIPPASPAAALQQKPPRAAPLPDDGSAAPIFCVEDDATLSAGQHMFAGALAGMTEHMAMYPVDTIKTRMQSYVAVRDFANLGMFHTTRTIVAAEGLRALWRGVGAVALSAGPAHALYFATYEAMRTGLAPDVRSDGQVHPLATAAAGGCATVVGDGIMTPLDVVKQRMQLSARGTYASVMQCTKHVYMNHGIRAFYAGYGATLVMNVPFTAVYFSGYETAKKLILDWRNIHENEFSVGSHCAAGAMAGAAAAAATNPLDVVKTRLQTQGEVGARRYRGLADALRSIRVEEGYGGLMRGVRPRVLFHMPAAAVCWTTYEFCKHLMNKSTADIERGPAT